MIKFISNHHNSQWLLYWEDAIQEGEREYLGRAWHSCIYWKTIYSEQKADKAYILYIDKGSERLHWTYHIVDINEVNCMFFLELQSDIEICYN